jgi:hypothetical protein
MPTTTRHPLDRCRNNHSPSPGPSPILSLSDGETDGLRDAMASTTFRMTHRFALVLATIGASTSMLASTFEPPHWTGNPGTSHSEWLDFTTAVGDPGNPPDVEGSTGHAVLHQWTPGATVTGTKNIYHPGGASVFTISESFDRPIQRIVLQTVVAGAPLDVDSVRLELGNDGGGVHLATAREELARVSGRFGDTVTSRWQWTLRERDLSTVLIRFAAAGAHSSLVAARLDLQFKPDAVEVVWDEPAHDRWGYPFNATPGTRPVASTFGSAEEEGRNRHGLFLVAFDTTPALAPGPDGAAYEIVSAKVTLMTSSNFQVSYDPSVDPVYSYLGEDHPQYVADNDPGRPLELFGAGFRNGYTSLSWTETAAYAPPDGDRNVYPVTWTDHGTELDASMNVNHETPYEAEPFAVGTIADLAPGAMLPFETPVVFEINTDRPGVHRYLQHGLQLGRLVFAVTSLHSGGHGMRTFPEYYTRDSLIGDAPRLELTVRLQEHQEIITLIPAPGHSPGALRFQTAEGAAYGIRWSTDLKNWHLIRQPALTAPESGVAEWVDESEPGNTRFYQVYRKP